MSDRQSKVIYMDEYLTIDEIIKRRVGSRYVLAYFDDGNGCSLHYGESISDSDTLYISHYIKEHRP